MSCICLPNSRITNDNRRDKVGAGKKGRGNTTSLQSLERFGGKRLMLASHY